MADSPLAAKVGWKEQLRRRPELRDTSKWPTPCGIDGLKPAKQTKYYRRRTALLRVVEGHPVREQAEFLRVSLNEMYRLLDRALSSLEGDDPILLVGLIPWKLRCPREGSFQALQRQYPSVFDSLRAAIRGNIKQSPDAVRITSVGVWGMFRTLLDEAGAKRTAYPFTTQDHARESLRKWVIETQVELTIPVLPTEGRCLVSGELFDVFDVFQFDGHLMDFESGLLLDTGRHQCPVKLPRIWVLCVCDENSNYIFGRSFGCSKQYRQEDVLDSLSDCTRARSLDTTDFSDLGLPPVRMPNAATLAAIQYAVPAMLMLDNAWANSATQVRRFVMTKWKSVINYGIPKQSIARRVVEMTFQRLAAFEHMLPSTTGTGPNDPARNANRSIPRVRIQDIPRLIDWAIATINSTPTQALKGMSPLEYVEHRVDQGAIFRRLDTSIEPVPNPFLVRERLKICGNTEGPDIYHVNLSYGRYTGSELGHMRARGETHTQVEYDRRDGRSINLINLSGKSIGELGLQGSWRLAKHEIRLRAEVCRAARRRRIEEVADLATHMQHVIDNSDTPRGALQLFSIIQAMQDNRLGARGSLGAAAPPVANEPFMSGPESQTTLPTVTQVHRTPSTIAKSGALKEWKPRIRSSTS